MEGLNVVLAYVSLPNLAESCLVWAGLGSLDRVRKKVMRWEFDLWPGICKGAEGGCSSMAIFFECV